MKAKPYAASRKSSPQEGRMVGFALAATLAPKDRVRVFRQLYGYEDKSQYGKYHYTRGGLLDRVGYVPFGRGVFIIPTGALKRVRSVLKGKARLRVRRVILTTSDRRRFKARHKGLE